MTVANATYSKPIFTTASGNTLVINGQVATALASAPADKLDAGIASFDSSAFTVDSNGYVKLVGSEQETACANYIVDPNGTKAEYTTIQEAIDAASEGDIVCIKEGTYTENLSITKNLTITSIGGPNRIMTTTNPVVIKPATSGSFTITGNVTFVNVKIETNGATLIDISTSGQSIAFKSCYLVCEDTYTMLTNTSGGSNSSYNFYDCHIQGEPSGTSKLLDLTQGNAQILYSYVEYFTTASTVATGIIYVRFCNITMAVTTSGTGILLAEHSTFGTTFAGDAVRWLTHNSSSNSQIVHCRLYSATETVIDIDSGTVLCYNSEINTSNANAIDGAGTFKYGGLTFSGSSSNVNATTKTLVKEGPNRIIGGTGHLTVPVGTTAQRPGTPLDGMIRYNSDDNTYEGYDSNTAGWLDLGAGSGSGDVVGPASATDNALCRFDTTTGKLIQNSTATLSDAGVMATAELQLTTALDETYGGTGQSSYTTGDMLYASASNTLSKLGIGSIPGDVVIVNDSGVIQWDTDVIVIKDDFIGTATNNQSVDSWDGAASATGIAATVDGIAGHPGIMRASVSATSDDAVIAKGVSSQGDPIVIGGGFLRLDFLIKIDTLADMTDDYALWVALGNGNPFNTGINGNGIGFEYIRATSTNWNPFTEASSTQTSASGGSTVAVDTNWTHLRMEINAAGTQVDFWIDGVDAGSSTTNIPSGALTPMVKVTKTAGSSERYVDIDAFRLYYKLTTSRWV